MITECAQNRFETTIKTGQKTNLDQIITPILGPDNIVTPERANLDQQENMIRRGRREERTKTKRGRKSITAENPKPTKHYKINGLRQLSRTPRLEHRKQVNFRKGGDKNWFLGPTQNTLRLRWFRPFFRKRKTRNPYSGRASPETVPFFFCWGKSYHKPFSEQTQFWAKKCVLRSLSDKKPYFFRGFWKGLEKSKTKQWRTTQVDSSEQHFCRVFFCQGSVSGKGPSSKTISRKTRFDNWSLQSSDETLRKPIFLENPNSRPHYRMHADPIIEPMNQKIRPHYRSLQHIYLSRMRFSKRKLHFLFFFYVGEKETKKKEKKENGKDQKNPIKIVFFKVVIQTCEKSKNGFLAKIAWHYLCQEGRRKTRIFVHTICFGQNFFWPKQCKAGNTIKIGVSAEIAKNKIWHLFLEKGVFWHGWKSGFY